LAAASEASTTQATTPDDEEGDADQQQRRDQQQRAVDGVEMPKFSASRPAWSMASDLRFLVPLAGLEPATC
jgi:hypothetical protein